MSDCGCKCKRSKPVVIQTRRVPCCGEKNCACPAVYDADPAQFEPKFDPVGALEPGL